METCAFIIKPVENLPVENLDKRLWGWNFVALRLFDRIEAAIHPRNRMYRKDICEFGQQHVISAGELKISDIWNSVEKGYWSTGVEDKYPEEW